jgi:hypothetical protein
MFFGTPHDGGDRTLVALGSAAARVATKLHAQPSNDLIETLKSGSMFSDILGELWRQQLLNYNIISFWEGIGDVSLLTLKFLPKLASKIDTKSRYLLDCSQEECSLRTPWGQRKYCQNRCKSQ